MFEDTIDDVDFMPERYSENQVKVDDRLFGYLPEEAYILLSENIMVAVEFLKPVIADLLRDEKFYSYLLVKKAIDKDVNHEYVLQNQELYSRNPSVVHEYLNYSILEGKTCDRGQNSAVLDGIVAIEQISSSIKSLSNVRLSI